MPNMSYCRFENTTGDLQDCIEAIHDWEEECKDLNSYEMRALKDLLEQAREIIAKNKQSLEPEEEEVEENETFFIGANNAKTMGISLGDSNISIENPLAVGTIKLAGVKSPYKYL